MIARRAFYLIVTVTLGGAAAYVFIYLYRWEWNRALMAGVLFLAAEVALMGAMLFHRLRVAGAPPAATDETLATIRESAPSGRRPFAWLEPDEDRLTVFIPVLIGAGVVLSAIAWLVERIARATAHPILERDLAARLGPLALPEHGFLGEDDDERLTLLHTPSGSSR